MDPLYLLAPRELLARRVDDVITRAGPRPGHVFNLGHGILPETPPDAVRFVADGIALDIWRAVGTRNGQEVIANNSF